MNKRLINLVLTVMLLVTNFSTQFINIKAVENNENKVVETVETTSPTNTVETTITTAPTEETTTPSVEPTSPVVTVAPENTTQPTEKPVETPEAIAPSTEAPVETVVPESTIKPTEKPVETAKPSVEPTAEPTVKPETTAPSTEAPVETVAPETEAPVTEPTEVLTVLDFPTLGIDQAVELIEQGESLVLFIGNSEDATFKANLSEYQLIKNGLEDQYAKDGMFVLDLATATSDNLAKLKAYAYRGVDKDSIDKAYADYTNKTSDNSATIYTFNQTITNVVKTIKDEDLTEDYTREMLVYIDYTTNYREKGDFNTTDSRPQANLFALKPEQLGAYPGDLWKYGAKARLQTFVAPVSGTYSIKLWGATGDSDKGLYVKSGPNTGKWSHGYGGGSGFTYADVELKEGETLYLALGLRNGFSFDRSYNGGGGGAPYWRGFRSGGGGAGSIYTSSQGTGTIADYQAHKEDILMVAGGGGGAEDFYHATWAYNPYPCSYEYCDFSYGGNGGEHPTVGSSTGPVPSNAGHEFGQGQDYNSYENASSGGGGGGYIGGLSGDGSTVVLKGGVGAGGSSYVNTSRLTNTRMANGTNVNISCAGDKCWEHDPQDIFEVDETSPVTHDAGAVITLKAIKTHTLTINYLDVYDKTTVLAPQYKETVTVGDVYNVPSPHVEGYTVYDPLQEVVEGIMPDHDVVIDVYYGYPGIHIHYQEYDTKETLHPSYEDHLKTGTPYDVQSPDIDGYVRVDDTNERVSGTKKETNEVYYVYYVPKFAPTKHITKVNGIDIPRELSDKGVALKTGDVVTYTIEYENKRLIDVTEHFEDALPNTVQYLGNVVGNASVNVNGQTVTFDVTVPARTKGSVSFDVKVTNTDENVPSIDNWNRRDPYIEYNVTKSSKPESGSYVGYGQEITYYLTVKNTGKNTVNNILVIDNIPNGTEFTWVNRDHHGSYVADGNYVRYVIDELVSGQIAKLEFKVRVTQRVTDSSEFTIKNFAKYQNYTDHIDGSGSPELDKNVIEKGQSTNEVIHKVVGPKIDIHKSANPPHGTTVRPGDVITYDVKLTNVGSVKSNFLRMTDDIPTGTTYVPNSLSLRTDNPASDNKYAVSKGSTFDIHYDFNSRTYRLENIADITTNTGKPVKALQIFYPSGVSVSSQNIPQGWTRYNVKGNTLYFNITNNNSQSTIKSYLESLRFSGSYGTEGSIRIEAFDSAMIGRFDDNGILHFYEFVGAEITWWNAKAAASNRWFGGLQGYLATITSLDEQKHLEHSVATIPGWLGGSDEGSEGYWTWRTGPEAGQGLVFQYWNVGEPNNNQGDEHYMQAFYADEAKWNDLSNGNLGAQHGYYVEYSDGYNGYYLNRSNYENTLPTPSNSGGCKYVTSNGRPYVECVTSDVEVGKSATMSFQVRVNNPVPSGLTAVKNTGMYETLWTDPGLAGTKTEKPTLPSNTTIHPLEGKKPNVNVVKSSNPVSGSLVDLEDNIVYTLAVTNSGSGVANYVVVRDNIPAQTTYLPQSINMGGVFNGTYCEWVLKDLQPGETRNLMFTVTVSKDADTTQKIRNHALFESYLENPGEPGMVEKEPGNKTNETIHKMDSPQEGTLEEKIVVTKGSNPVDGTAIARNTDVEYSIQIVNDGKTTLRRIYVKDMIPEGTTFKELLPHEDATASPKVEVKQVYNKQGNFCEWCVEMLKPGDRVTLKFVVTVDKETPLKEINNIAKYHVSKENLGNVGEIDDSKYDKVTNTIKHPLIDPEVKVIKSSEPASGSVIGRGRNIKYILTVENTGTVLANYVAVEDTIPSETTYVENSAKTSVKTDKKSLSPDKSSVQFLLFDMEPGEIRTVEFTVTVKDSTRQGDLIRNVAFYDPHITPPGEPGTDLIPPQTETNEVTHTVDMGVDLLPTGGEGWSSFMPLIGATILALGIGTYAYNKKRK